MCLSLESFGAIGGPQRHAEHELHVQEGDPAGWWEEVFKGHTDAKPKGPEAISLDIVFPGIDNVYGIPEHATRLSLEPTAGNLTTNAMPSAHSMLYKRSASDMRAATMPLSSWRPGLT